jgi:hypothetical protein
MEISVLDFKHLPWFEYCIVSFELFSGVLIYCADVSEQSISSNFVGGVSRKNNRDEIVVVFIREKFGLEISLRQLEGVLTGRGGSEWRNSL